MAENTNTEETKAPEYTSEQLAEIFNSLPEAFQQSITETNAEVDVHNENVEKIKSAEAKNPVLIKAEIYEQNTKNNKKLAVLRERELKLQDQIEKIREEAYKVIDEDGLMPKELTEEQVEKLKAEVTESTKALRAKAEVLAGMEAMMPPFKGKITIHLKEIKTRRGTAKTGGATAKGEGPKRPRFKKIEINGVTQDESGNTVYQMVDGEPKYTFTFAANYLKKQHKGIKWSSKDLTDAYFGDKSDQSELPEKHEFVMPFTYKAENGNEHTIEYKVTCYR